MKFRVGPWAYTVVIRDELRGRDGRVLDGEAVEETRELLVGGHVKPEHRLEVVLHELRHAWEFVFPAPRTAEEEARFSSAIIASAHQDLADQGGEAALIAMACEERVQSIPNPIPGPVGAIVGAECIGCGGRFTPQHVATEPHRIDDQLGARVVDRGVYCDFCGHVQVWVELATAGGTPTGTVIRQAMILHGREAMEWLERYGRTVLVSGGNDEVWRRDGE